MASFVVIAPASIGAQSAGPVDLGSADTKIVGESADDRAGWSVASAGDVNGDGVEDLIVGVPGNDTAAGNDSGAAYLFFGPVDADNVSVSEANATLTGVAAGDQAGWSVASAGDVNGDGMDDVLVGAPTNDDNGDSAGAAYVVHGGSWLSGSMSLDEANATLLGGEDDRAGWSVSNTSTPPDNQSAILVGAPTNDDGSHDAGAVFVVEGDVEGDVSLEDESIAKLNGVATGDHAGSSVAGVGDVDADGSDDILVGAPSSDSTGTDSGAAYLVTREFPARAGGPPEDRGPPDDRGPPEDRGPSGDGDRVTEVSLDRAAVTMTGEAQNDSAGHAVAGAGDVNDDGVADVIVGAPYNDAGGNDSGAAYVVYGGDSLPEELELADADVRLDGEAEGDHAGWSVASTSEGAVDCDGVDDVLVGAPQHDADATDAGAAYAVAGNESLAGSVSLADANTTYLGEAANDSAGHSVASVGDVNDDGVDDVAVGAPHHDMHPDAGAVYLVQGECPEPKPGYGYGYESR